MTAWRATFSRVHYLRAQSVRTRTFLWQVVGVPLGAATGAAALGILIIYAQAFSKPAGGMPKWWTFPIGLALVGLGVALGGALGIALYRRPLLASLLAPALVAGLIAAAWLRERSAWFPFVTFPWASAESLLYLNPVPLLLWGSFALAVLGVILLLALVSRAPTAPWPLGGVVGTCVVLCLLSATLPATTQHFQPRPQPAHAACTHEVQGLRVCSWDEDAYRVSQADATWDEVVTLLHDTDIPVGSGTIATTGLDSLQTSRLVPNHFDRIDIYSLPLDIAETALIDAAPDIHAPGAEWTPFHIGHAVARIIRPEAPEIRPTGICSSEIRGWLARTSRDEQVASIRDAVHRYRSGEPAPSLPWDPAGHCADVMMGL